MLLLLLLLLLKTIHNLLNVVSSIIEHLNFNLTDLMICIIETQLAGRRMIDPMRYLVKLSYANVIKVKAKDIKVSENDYS